VLPSEWYENAPVSVLEAYALGKPVIGARIGGIPELVRENVTGVSFESGNVAALAAALLDMHARNDTELEQMGRAGRLWVEQEFTVDMYRQRILAAYRELGIALPVGDALPVSARL
jgi:glycosyltransferase involved in cell wall biosynthesis